VAPSEIILVVAPDESFRHSLQFALASDGFCVDTHRSIADAFASEHADAATCAVVDDDAIDNWKQAQEQFSRFARPVILLVSLFRTAPELPLVRPLMKPFLGEPLIEAVRSVVAGTL
jgi:DNA-binding response OmpR family regulator